uniref:LPS-assembly lipoprotein LptE n=1 Tax=Candidatus Kentrum sp. MB TaxID=2138164 RepID=A0A450X803_9GAMM|nr:MAG: LPS-assembly lipoprotein [Candidatus Kentron sp. MB]VFK29122.1 MAG: LPS-assembly lipoprotein [Candidatus Kentron sp. MB]VFK74679.1 MAG: LPS-assembly lipoprotein [Candidatus Kentron sp. MB]
MPLVRFTGLFLIAIILTGCGFHLRGSFVLPKAISPLYIEIYGTEQGGRQLHINELTVLLEANDVIVTSNRQDASAILVLGTEVLDKRTLSVDSNTGKERERELAYTISYRLLASDGKELLPRQVVSLVRDYVFDEDVALSTSREEHILYQEMRQEAAQQILRRLAAWSP